MSAFSALNVFGGGYGGVRTTAVGVRGQTWESRPLQAIPARNTRLALLQALSSQAASQSQRFVESVIADAAKFVNSVRGQEPRNLEEALMTVPNLETIPYKTLRREASYEIREVESYLVAETEMGGQRGFDFVESGQAFNTLAAYLFGKNSTKEEMQMTTPVTVQKGKSQGEKMEMTTPVLSQKVSEDGTWRMAFVLPSKYSESELPVPEDVKVNLIRVPAKTVATVAFSGFVTDDVVKRKEAQLREALFRDLKVRVKVSAQPEVAQYNPPFTPPFLRRNEISLEVESVQSANGTLHHQDANN